MSIYRTAAIISASLFLSLVISEKARALEPDGSIAISLPKGVQIRNVAVAAAGSINLADRSVVGGPTASVGSVTNVGPGQTQLGVTTKVGTNVISVAKAFLANNARIGGALLTTTAPSLQLGATVAGGTTANAQLTPTNRLAWMPPAAGAGNDFILSPDATGAISAGSFRNVTIYSRAKVTLGAGVYQMNSFDLEPQATVTFDNRNGPIVIYLTSGLIMRGTSVVLGSANNLALVYEGANGTAIEMPFSGTIVAPYAQLRLAAMGTRKFVGQFVGQSIVVDPDVQVTYAPFNWSAIQPLFGGGNGIAGTQLTPAIHGAPLACFAPSFTGTTQASNGDVVYSSVHVATANPSQGVCAPRFCDVNGNPVAGPTDAQLNSPPAPGSTCPAAPANTPNCPIDASSLTVTCTSDADCGTGGVCAAHCLDPGCTSIEHRCGRLSASCADLPAESNCDEFRLCPIAGAVGTPNAVQLTQQLAPTSTPSASGQIPPTEQDTPPPAYVSALFLHCADLSPPEKQENLSDGSDKPANDGSPQWGIFIKPVTSFNVKPTKRTDGIGELSMQGGGGVSAGGIIFGNSVEVLGATVNATADDCGIKLVGAVKFFGETIATWTPSAGQTFHLATDNTGGSLATPALDNQNCKAARDNAKNAIRDARRSNVLARAVREYYFQNGLTPDLCRGIQEQLGTASIKDPNTNLPFNCDDLGSISPVGKINILNAWKEEYDGNTAKYVDFSKNLGTAHQAIQTSGTIDVFKTPHPYSVSVLDQDFPIGPITLNLAVEGFGSWDIIGGIQFGVGVSGNFDKATAILANGLHGEAPSIGDIRGYAGPVITPDLQVGIVAFVGVGIPGVSVGIQGQIDLLDISLPSGIVVSAMRLSEPDPRTLAGTSYAGAPIPGMEPHQYRWLTGYTWNSKLTLSELNGEVDLAVRIHFLFFKHTFKQKLFSWPGFTQSFQLVGGSGGSDLAFTGDYGKQADIVAYTAPVPAITDPVNVQQLGPAFACFISPK